MSTFWVSLDVTFLIFLPILSAKGVSHLWQWQKGSWLSCSSSQTIVWPKLIVFFSGGVRCRAVTWATWVAMSFIALAISMMMTSEDLAHNLIPCSNIHWKLLISQCSSSCSWKKLRKKKTIFPVILSFQNSLNTTMLLPDQAVLVALSCLCASPLPCVSGVLCRYWHWSQNSVISFSIGLFSPGTLQCSWSSNYSDSRAVSLWVTVVISFAWNCTYTPY